MDWSTLLTLAAVGLMFFLMMRHGGGCCDGSRSRPQDIRNELSSNDEARPEREQPSRR